MQRRQFIAAGSSLLLALPAAARLREPAAAPGLCRHHAGRGAEGAGRRQGGRNARYPDHRARRGGGRFGGAARGAERAGGTEALSILVEKNRTQLIARFTLPEGTLANINTRIKMSEGSRVLGIAHTKAGVFSAAREVKVTQGGCGPGDPSGRAPDGAAFYPPASAPPSLAAKPR